MLQRIILFQKWEITSITHDANSNIFITSSFGSGVTLLDDLDPNLRSQFLGDWPKRVGDDIIGSTMPVPWRLIKADSSSFF